MAADEDRILTRCQLGNEDAMQELIDCFRERIYRIAYRILENQASAEDATVDAIALIWEKCGSWNGRSSASTWVHRVACNVILDHQRAKRRWWRFRLLGNLLASPEVDEDIATAIAEQDQKDYQTRSLLNAISRLSADDKMLVHLHYFEDKSLAEVAEIMAVKRDTLKMRLSRLRAELRLMLGESPEIR